MDLTDPEFPDRISHLPMVGKQQDLVLCRQAGQGLQGRFAPFLVEIDQDVVDNKGNGLALFQAMLQ